MNKLLFVRAKGCIQWVVKVLSIWLWNNAHNYSGAALVRFFGIGLAAVRYWLICFLFLFQGFGALAQDQTEFKVCIDANFWGPYTFVREDQASGLHVEMANLAFKRLGIKAVVRPWPWKRCLAYGRAGEYDAILSAGYAADRVQDFYYPEGADLGQSPLRVTRAEYVVVMRKADVFDWDGKQENLPQPVGLPIGYAGVEAMRSSGLKVSQATSYNGLFRMLARGRVNAIVLPRRTAAMYLQTEQYELPLGILDKPLRSTAYYLVVSKAGKIPEAQALRIWREIAGIRKDKEQMGAISAKVKQELEQCFSKISRCNN